jgi:hypothetical protein
MEFILATILWLVILAIPIYGLFTTTKNADRTHGRGASRTNVGASSTT